MFLISLNIFYNLNIRYIAKLLIPKFYYKIFIKEIYRFFYFIN